jgi:hypothetical protein
VRPVRCQSGNCPSSAGAIIGDMGTWGLRSIHVPIFIESNTNASGSGALTKGAISPPPYVPKFGSRPIGAAAKGFAEVANPHPCRSHCRADKMASVLHRVVGEPRP